MSWSTYFAIVSVCIVTMLICRVVPVFVLKDKELPETVSRALGFIPPAAFAALVANDLISEQLLFNPTPASLLPFVAALAVVLVAVKTKSLIWCIVVGVATFGLLLLLV